MTVPRPGPQGQEVWHEDNGERSRGRAHHDCRHHDGDGTGGEFHHSCRHGLRRTGTVHHGIRQGPAGRFRAPADAVRQTNEDALVGRGVQRRRAGAHGVPGLLSDRQVRGVEQRLWRLHQGNRSSSAGLLGRSPTEQAAAAGGRRQLDRCQNLLRISGEAVAHRSRMGKGGPRPARQSLSLGQRLRFQQGEL